jgi:hypothetical protein
MPELMVLGELAQATTRQHSDVAAAKGDRRSLQAKLGASR